VPRFEPFRGIRYDPALDLNRLIAPPYDVVGPAERAALAARHRANAIHVELPEPDRAAGMNRYENAARLLGNWRSEGLLIEEPGPALYRYRMTPPGSGRATLGVIGALGLEPPGVDVLPHEQTMAKDETDRLELIRATSANLSPIWGLSLTDGLAALCEPGPGPAPASATDDEGVLHELWVVDDAADIEALCLAVAANPVVLADGHHRYSVARRYRDEQRDSHDGISGPYDLVMAFVVELEEGGLDVGPIHKALAVPSERQQLLDVIGSWFEVVDAGEPDPAVISAVSSSQALAMIAPDNLWLLTPRPEAYEAAGSDLDSSLVALVTESMPGTTVAHFHDWREAVATVERGDSDVAILVRPVTVAQIRHWARERRLMPPKSTYFYPKPRTGMVYRSLES
jgi:uncharacterized protein (DUF1015 family)